MKYLLFLPFFLYLQSLHAHPGIGIVCDSKGNVYYTDLNQVWKVTPGGEKSVFVPRVHTHELYINAQDHLYGEDAWYEGEATDQWGFAVWKKDPDGTMEFVIDSTRGFLSEHPFGFVHDEAGNRYWRVRKKNDYTFYKRTPEGKTEKLATNVFENIRWMYWLRNRLHVMDMDDLYRLEQGVFKPVAKDLRSEALPFSEYIRDMHSMMGVWDDPSGNIYAAVFSGKVVKQIRPDGTVSDFIKTKGNWSPAGGLFDKDNNLWLLEYSSRNEARVRKISPEGLKTAAGKADASNDLRAWIIAILVILLAGGFIYLKSRK